ncbi:NAD-dependent epimerase/dehydratase family protein [Maritalea mediterranea]|uniref:NAD-dependent epimerase/dehydratase family protein n=1 Tax=Maritalea mediterranea TaxID=2909667 RepID=A0ABS9E958_9HYPH|nr:NAD-dependent epimerase/dehydratase family protein [Maritalea mediterranea]MCF4099425.1 NAD-dependent epimerase/dehydratase family protein [Maritalea mediterranea]
MTNNSTQKVTILGINGRIGQFAAKAFIDAGWQVKGFGRENRAPFQGFEFVQGDAFNLKNMQRAVAGADVVVHALNLPYDKWADQEKGAVKLNHVVIEAMKGSGKTLIFAGNIYNYAAKDHKLTPDLPQRPATDKGEIRVQMEQDLVAAGRAYNFQVIVIRASDFFGPDASGSWFDLAIGREFAKSKITRVCDGKTKHSWAYLPDLGRAFEKVAAQRDQLGAYENFHFAGFRVTGDELIAEIQRALSTPYKVVQLPWWVFNAMALFNPMMREIVKMRYLWQEPHELVDPKLDAILGPNFGTPFERAVAETTHSLLSESELAKITVKRAA